MAKLYITEYSDVGKDNFGNSTYSPKEPAVAGQAVTFTTETDSSAFNASTRFVRLIADANCHILFGTSVTADTDDQFIPANVEVFRHVDPGDVVSVVQAS